MQLRSAYLRNNTVSHHLTWSSIKKWILVWISAPSPRFLPTPCRWAACPSPGATPSSSFSPSPPWSLGCDPRRSRGKAWLPVLDTTCNCSPLFCSSQLPYTVPLRCAPFSFFSLLFLFFSAHPAGLYTKHKTGEKKKETKPWWFRPPPRLKAEKNYSMGGTGGEALNSCFPWMSLIQ